MKKKTDVKYLEHLNELRKRAIRVLIVFALFFILGFYKSSEILEIIRLTSLKINLDLNVFKITDPLSIYVQISSLSSFIITIPYCLFELWLFIKPGLTRKEKKFFLKYIPIIFILFIMGISFAYFIIVPYYITFSQRLAHNNNLNTIIGTKEYIEFIIKTVFPFGIAFQLPTIVFVLSRIGIIQHKLLKTIRGYAYLALMIISAFITPPDPVSMLIVLLPLAFLYETSILIAKQNEKKDIKKKTN